MAETSLARGYVFATMIIVIWTGFILVARLGGIGHLTPFDVVAVRMITASALVLPLWLYSGRYRRFDRRMIVLTLTGGLGYTLFVFSAFHLAPAAHAGILLSGLQPLAMAFCAWAVTGERPTSQRLVGIGVIVLGAGVLGMTVLQGGASSWAGDLLFIGAAFCWALYTVLARKWEVSPWVVTVNVALLASLAYLPVYVLALPKQLALASFGEIALQAL